jgi:hypothetical protein
MSIFSQFTNKIARYVDVRVKLVKITLIEKTSALLSYFMYALIALFIVFCILLFCGFGLLEAFVMAGLSRMAASFITLGIYCLMLFALIALRKNIIRGFSNLFVSVMTDAGRKDDDDDDDDKREEE